MKIVLSILAVLSLSSIAVAQEVSLSYDAST